MNMLIAQGLLPTRTILPAVQPAEISLILFGSMALCVVIAWIYKGTHRGLSYSQSFQFSLVVIGMLSAAVMMVARVSLLNAVGILGVFALVRFRTIVKDTKDMAYILFVLVVGLAMGTKEYALAVITTAAVGLVILVLTRIEFGLAKNHESIIRVVATNEGGVSLDTAAFEGTLERLTDSFTLLSAHTHGTRIEMSYGIKPKRSANALAILEALRLEAGVENAELFDAKHQVEF
jgi:hypothetical protein